MEDKLDLLPRIGEQAKKLMDKAARAALERRK
jgi:hypothetical protein